MEDKAIQVSHHKENTSSESRLGEQMHMEVFCFLVISFKKVKLTTWLNVVRNNLIAKYDHQAPGTLRILKLKPLKRNVLFTYFNNN